LSKMTCYDVASNICQALPDGDCHLEQQRGAVDAEDGAGGEGPISLVNEPNWSGVVSGDTPIPTWTVQGLFLGETTILSGIALGEMTKICRMIPGLLFGETTRLSGVALGEMTVMSGISLGEVTILSGIALGEKTKMSRMIPGLLFG
jgi:hypothetical protein